MKLLNIHTERINSSEIVLRKRKRKEKNMKVLIVGGGGREHAIAVSMKKSPRVDKLYCTP